MKVYVVNYNHYETAYRDYGGRLGWVIDKEFTELECPESYGNIVGVYGNRKKAIKAIKAFNRNTVRHTDNELEYELIDDRVYVSKEDRNTGRSIIERAYDGKMKFEGHINIYIDEYELNKQP